MMMFRDPRRQLLLPIANFLPVKQPVSERYGAMCVVVLSIMIVFVLFCVVLCCVATVEFVSASSLLILSLILSHRFLSNHRPAHLRRWKKIDLTPYKSLFESTIG